MPDLLLASPFQERRPPKSAAASLRTNGATGAVRQAKSNDLGLYTISLLPPGLYHVTVERDGFRSLLQTGIGLAIDQRAGLNFALEVGGAKDQVEVKSAVSRLNTVEASQGQVIDNQRIVEMPLNGRNYIDLVLMSGGAVTNAQTPRNLQFGLKLIW